MGKKRLGNYSIQPGWCADLTQLSCDPRCHDPSLTQRIWSTPFQKVVRWASFHRAGRGAVGRGRGAPERHSAAHLFPARGCAERRRRTAGEGHCGPGRTPVEGAGDGLSEHRARTEPETTTEKIRCWGGGGGVGESPGENGTPGKGKVGEMKSSDYKIIENSSPQREKSLRMVRPPNEARGKSGDTRLSLFSKTPTFQRAGALPRGGLNQAAPGDWVSDGNGHTWKTRERVVVPAARLGADGQLSGTVGRGWGHLETPGAQGGQLLGPGGPSSVRCRPRQRPR